MKTSGVNNIVSRVVQHAELLEKPYFLAGKMK